MARPSDRLKLQVDLMMGTISPDALRRALGLDKFDTQQAIVTPDVDYPGDPHKHLYHQAQAIDVPDHAVDSLRYDMESYARRDADATMSLYNQKGTSMSMRKEIIRQQLAALQEELYKLSCLPEVDDFDESTVLRFAMKFDGDIREFVYAAVKADGQWWVTGVKGRQVFGNWDLFVNWLGTKVQYLEVMVPHRELLNGIYTNAASIDDLTAEAPLPKVTDMAKDFRSKTAVEIAGEDYS